VEKRFIVLIKLDTGGHRGTECSGKTGTGACGGLAETGMGTKMMKSLMKKKNVASLDEMIEMAAEFGVRIFICEMSMDPMGFKHEEMIDYPELTYCGLAKFLDEAIGSRVQLFI